MDVEKLKKLYVEIADLTLADCKKNCKKIGSCCDIFYCNLAIQIAKDDYQLELKLTGNRIPLLDNDNKCVAPPHIRQLCSAHSCDINAVGHFKGDKAGTDRYFALRFEIDELEAKRFENIFTAGKHHAKL